MVRPEGLEPPSLTGTKSFTDEVRDVLTERIPKYQAAAHYVVETDDISIAQVIERIKQAILHKPVP